MREPVVGWFELVVIASLDRFAHFLERATDVFEIVEVRVHLRREPHPRESSVTIEGKKKLGPESSAQSNPRRREATHAKIGTAVLYFSTRVVHQNLFNWSPSSGGPEPNGVCDGNGSKTLTFLKEETRASVQLSQ